MSQQETEATESYSTFWDEPPRALVPGAAEPGDPYAEFTAATEDDPIPEPFVDAA